MEISVVINTKNEEECIDRCLNSILWSDEIVVMDMNSDDGTVEIARRHTPHVYFCPDFGYVEPARNMAIGKATKEWVLILDADETIPENFARDIRKVIGESGDHVLIAIPRRSYMGGHRVTNLGIGGDHQYRLFKRGKVKWQDAIHSTPLAQGRIRMLPESDGYYIRHDSHKNFTDFIERTNRYTGIEAAALVRGGATFTWQDVQRGMIDEFYARYSSANTGIHDLLVAVGMAFYRFLAFGKALETMACENKGFEFTLPQPEEISKDNFVMKRQIEDQTLELQRLNQALDRQAAIHRALTRAPLVKTAIGAGRFFSNLIRPALSVYRLFIPYPGLAIREGLKNGRALNGVSRLNGTLRLPCEEPEPVLELRAGRSRVPCKVELSHCDTKEDGFAEYHFSCEYPGVGKPRFLRLMLVQPALNTKLVIASGFACAKLHNMRCQMMNIF